MVGADPAISATAKVGADGLGGGADGSVTGSVLVVAVNPPAAEASPGTASTRLEVPLLAIMELAAPLGHLCGCFLSHEEN
ncbi:hypothetical protein C6341_g22815 [Phytophthora cactorum]|nr:hypothetical protein C6341_g22815 [Phytophthora cactorum]